MRSVQTPTWRLWLSMVQHKVGLTPQYLSLKKYYAFLSYWNIYLCLFLCLGSFISFFFPQGAVIEPCAKGVYFVHLFKQTQTFNAFKNL